MANLWFKRFLGLALIGATVAGFSYALRPKPTIVDIATLARGAIEVTIAEEGQTRIRDVYQVFAPVAGRIDRSALSVGDPVYQGVTVVAEIHPVQPPFQDERTRRDLEARMQSAQAAVGFAEAEVRRAQSDYALAKTELSRVERLYRQGITSGAAFDRTKAELASRKAILLQAIAGLRMRRSDRDGAQAQLTLPTEATSPHSGSCCVTVIAPHDGAALKIPSKSERVVAQGALLAEIGDPNDLEIVVDLLSNDAVRIDVGTPARILQWGGKGVLEARVRRIDPVGFTKVSALGIEEQRVNVVLDLTSAPADYIRLDHEFRVFVEVVVDRVDDSLRLPLGALFRDGNAWAVFQIEGGIARLTKVDLGVRDVLHAEVLSGLVEGDRVVLHPSDKIEDGSVIEDRNNPQDRPDSLLAIKSLLDKTRAFLRDFARSGNGDSQ